MKVINVVLFFVCCSVALFSQPTVVPAPGQKIDLIYMYEEEKMARDLYTEITLLYMDDPASLSASLRIEHGSQAF
jgi:hypothetical protein